MDDNYILKKEGYTTRSVKELKNWNEYNGPPPENYNSTHPYWAIQGLLNDLKSYKKHKKQYELCKNDFNQIKFLYNMNTSLNDIKNRLDKYEESIQILKYLKIIQ